MLRCSVRSGNVSRQSSEQETSNTRQRQSKPVWTTTLTGHHNSRAAQFARNATESLCAAGSELSPNRTQPDPRRFRRFHGDHRVCRSGHASAVAERVGFEPTVRLPVHRISSAAHSTSLPPLREASLSGHEGPSGRRTARLADAGPLAKPPRHASLQKPVMVPARGLPAPRPPLY